MDETPLAIQIALAKLEQSMIYMQRDITDIKSQYVSEVARVKDKVEDHQTILDQMRGSLRVLTRAQSLLYAVFLGGVALGTYVMVHHP